MSRLILHIGTHKTATTSIQRFFRHNAAALSERGVFYPDYSLVNRKPHYAHLGLVNALSGRHKNYSRELAETFFAKVRERVKDHDLTVISAEPFYRHVENDPGDDPYYSPEDYWPLRNAYIERMREVFGEAEVVVVFRRQIDYAQSLYQEHVKVTSYRGNFHQFLKDFWFHFVFADQARAWNTAFPGLKAMSFDRLAASGDTVGEFCRLLGIPAEGLEAVPRANEGLPVDMVILKRMLHRTPVNRDELRDQVRELAARLPEDVQETAVPRSFFQSAGEMKAFQQSHAAANEGLRPFLVHGLADDEPIFRTEMKKGLTFGDRVKPQVLLAMLQLAVQGQRAEEEQDEAD
jgi:hypothetical protein